MITFRSYSEIIMWNFVKDDVTVTTHGELCAARQFHAIYYESKFLLNTIDHSIHQPSDNCQADDGNYTYNNVFVFHIMIVMFQKKLPILYPILCKRGF